jgi:hypothetical protein
MQKYIPLIILLLIVIGLAVYFGPGMYRSYLFRRDCSQLIEDIKAGKLNEVVCTVEKPQQFRIKPLVKRYITPDFCKQIKSLKLSSWETREPGSIWSILTLQLDEGGEKGIYQGKLHWNFDGKRWWWDFENSYGAPMATTGEPQWVKFGSLVDLIEEFQ